MPDQPVNPVPPTTPPATQPGTPPPSSPVPGKPKTRPVFWLILVLVVLAAGIIIPMLTMPTFYPQILFRMTTVFTAKDKEASMSAIPESTAPTPGPSPTPIQLISGPDTYFISHTKTGGPTIKSATFDPLDVHQGEKITISITVSDLTPINSVKATLEMDNSIIDLPLILVEGDDTNGIWKATVTPQDTLWYKYILRITTVGVGGTSYAIVAPRS